MVESGYHTDVWLTLDTLFVDRIRIAPLIRALADRIRPHAISAVCGPETGGAVLAQHLATALGVDFLYTRPRSAPKVPGLFKAEYELPADLKSRAGGQRVAVVDDVISAGSSVRATVAALTTAGAATVVVAALLILGDAAITHFGDEGVAVETLERREFVLWTPAECPLCRASAPLEDPRKANER